MSEIIQYTPIDRCDDRCPFLKFILSGAVCYFVENYNTEASQKLGYRKIDEEDRKKDKPDRCCLEQTAIVYRRE